MMLARTHSLCTALLCSLLLLPALDCHAASNRPVRRPRQVTGFETVYIAAPQTTNAVDATHTGRYDDTQTTAATLVPVPVRPSPSPGEPYPTSLATLTISLAQGPNDPGSMPVIVRPPVAPLSRLETPQMLVVARWPQQIKMGSQQLDFTSWASDATLMTVGASAAIATPIWLVFGKPRSGYLHLLLLASFLFLTATVLDISLVGQRPSTDASHINPQSYLAAIAFGLAHSTLYLWLFCVIVNKRSFDMFEEKPTNLSLQDLAGQAKARLRVTLALRMLAGLLLLPITILEVAWRIALLHSLRTGVLLHRSCCVTELLLLGMVWLPLMAQIMVGTARMGALGSAWHWIAVFFLVAGCGIEIARLAASLIFTTFTESPLGRLLLTLELLWFFGAAAALTWIWSLSTHAGDASPDLSVNTIEYSGPTDYSGPGDYEEGQHIPSSPQMEQDLSDTSLIKNEPYEPIRQPQTYQRGTRRKMNRVVCKPKPSLANTLSTVPSSTFLAHLAAPSSDTGRNDQQHAPTSDSRIEELRPISSAEEDSYDARRSSVDSDTTPDDSASSASTRPRQPNYLGGVELTYEGAVRPQPYQRTSSLRCKKSKRSLELQEAADRLRMFEDEAEERLTTASLQAGSRASRASTKSDRTHWTVTSFFNNLGGRSNRTSTRRTNSMRTSTPLDINIDWNGRPAQVIPPPLVMRTSFSPHLPPTRLSLPVAGARSGANQNGTVVTRSMFSPTNTEIPSGRVSRASFGRQEPEMDDEPKMDEQPNVDEQEAEAATQSPVTQSPSTNFSSSYEASTMEGSPSPTEQHRVEVSPLPSSQKPLPRPEMIAWPVME